MNTDFINKIGIQKLFSVFYPCGGTRPRLSVSHILKLSCRQDYLVKKTPGMLPYPVMDWNGCLLPGVEEALCRKELWQLPFLHDTVFAMSGRAIRVRDEGIDLSWGRTTPCQGDIIHEEIAV